MPRPFPKRIADIKPIVSKVALTSNYLMTFGGLTPNLQRYLKKRGMNSRFLGEEIGLLCSRASLPGSSFATADIIGNFTGVTERMVHTRQFVQMDLDFYVDDEYRALKFLEHWMEFAASGSTTTDGVDPAVKGYYYRMRYPDEYKCDYTKIVKFEKDYKRYIEYRFIGLFPISLNATTVSYEGSQILKATASFNYERYIAGQSYSINYATGTDNNKKGTKPGGGSPGNAADYASTNNDSGIIVPADGSFSNLAGLFSNSSGASAFNISSGAVLNSSLLSTNSVNPQGATVYDASFQIF